jgi:hypothetical protein
MPMTILNPTASDHTSLANGFRGALLQDMADALLPA